MKIIQVRASKEYAVKIGAGLLRSLGSEAVALRKAKKVAIVSDITVWPLYGSKAAESLQSAGLQTVHF